MKKKKKSKGQDRLTREGIAVCDANIARIDAMERKKTKKTKRKVKKRTSCPQRKVTLL